MPVCAKTEQLQLEKKINELWIENVKLSNEYYDKQIFANKYFIFRLENKLLGYALIVPFLGFFFLDQEEEKKPFEIVLVWKRVRLSVCPRFSINKLIYQNQNPTKKKTLFAAP